MCVNACSIAHVYNVDFHILSVATAAVNVVVCKIDRLQLEWCGLGLALHGFLSLFSGDR